jgi:Icc-related predicted phosphoesterase
MASEPHRVAFYADLFYNSVRSPGYWIPPTDLEVEAILLGGDIHYLPEQLGEMVSAIRRTQANATTIIVVPGNGEYTDQELVASRRQYRAAVESVPNAIFLDDNAVVLPTGLRVVGSTLWSYVDDDQMESCNKMLADHGLLGVDNIRFGGQYLTLRDTNELHLQARSFIEAQLRGTSGDDRNKTIVCTHFWPTLRPWLLPSGEINTEAMVTDEIDPSWYQMVGSDMDALITEYGPKVWLCGHAHTSKNVMVGTTKVSSNPRAGNGPGNINPDFEEHYVVQL